MDRNKKSRKRIRYSIDRIDWSKNWILYSCFTDQKIESYSCFTFQETVISKMAFFQSIQTHFTQYSELGNSRGRGVKKARKRERVDMKGAFNSLMSILICDGSVWLRLIAVITPTLTRTKPVITYVRWIMYRTKPLLRLKKTLVNMNFYAYSSYLQKSLEIFKMLWEMNKESKSKYCTISFLFEEYHGG